MSVRLGGDEQKINHQLSPPTGIRYPSFVEGRMTMHRSLFAATLLSATMVWPAAAAAAPSIAYSIGKDVFLTSPTGTGTVKVWSGPGKMVVSGLDFDPGSNRIAVLGTDRVLRIVSYSSAGVAQSVASIPTDNCIINGFDFHPSDGRLLVSRWCNSANSLEVRIHDGGGYSATIGSYGDPVNNAVSVIRWTPDGSGFFIGHVSGTNPAKIERRSLALPDAPTTVWSRNGASLPGWFDTARCPNGVDSSCQKLLVTDGITISAVPYDDFGGGAPVAVVSNGVNGHYSPDNSEIVFKSQVRNGYQLKVAGAGGTRTIVSKGDVGSIDWRP
jgi:WD40 repeat protein